MKIRILGTGAYVPQQVVDAETLDVRLNLPPGTSYGKNQVRNRYFANPEETSVSMGTAAVREALSRAGMAAGDLDVIIGVSAVPHQHMPTNAAFIHRELGVDRPIVCFDVNASCLGFLQALQVASSLISSGQARYVAIVAVEVTNKGLDWNDLDTCTLFGAGAAAAVVGASGAGESSEILGFRFETFSEGAEFCQIAAGGSRWNVTTPPPSPEAYLFNMKTSPVLRLVMARVPEFKERLYSGLKLDWKDIKCMVPHQASRVTLKLFARHLEVPEGKMVDILETYGNQVSASLPTALHMAIKSERLVRGDKALLFGAGAGILFGAALMRY